MTVASRLAALERRATARAATAARADDPEAWWRLAPDAVLDYYLAIDDEARADPRWDGTPETADDLAHAAHPLLDRVQFAVELAARHKPLPVALGRVQWDLLAAAWLRVGTAVAAERGNLHDGETERLTRLRLYGLDGDALSDAARRFGQAWEDRTGETWLRLWRERGTADAAVLGAAGLGAAELALLAADG